jgi:hypothetical protein
MGGNTTGGVGPGGGTGGSTAATGGTVATGGISGTAGIAGSPGGVAGTAGSATGGAGNAGGSGGGAGNAGGMAGTSGSTTGGTGGTGGAVTCTLPTLPETGALTTNTKLPDPFTFFNGTKLTRKDQWECRRHDILAMAAKYLYAPVPTKPDRTTGTVSGSNVTMNVTVGTRSAMFTATISGSGTAIAYSLSGGIYPSSRKALTFGSGYAASIRTLFGFSADVNPNIAIGWMIDRVMDVLEANPGSGHDPTKIMVSGCSGCGKGAYLVGVFSRVPLTVIVESGGGGVANLRQAEWFRHGAGNSRWMCADALPQSIDNLESNGICGPWVTSASQWLSSMPANVNKLPFDTHLLLATIAPRHLVHFTNNNGTNSWCHLGGTCEALSAWAAKPVWKALGVPERFAFQMYSAGHCSNPSSATSLANLMFQRVFDGNMSVATDVMTIMDNGVQQPVSEWQSSWVDWDMNTVLQ